MILDFTNKWNPGDTIGVSFVNGSEKLKKRIEAIAKEWEQYANITFDFGATDAPIRIEIDSPSNDSKIGTEFLTFKDPATMHFANLHDETNEAELRHKILHEFGHALGLIHEHFNPDFAIKMVKDKVLKQFKSQGLTENEIDQNVMKEYYLSQLYYSEFDPESIMTYEIPPDCTTDGISTKIHSELSEMDKMFISRIYPKDIKDPEIYDLSKDLEFEMDSPYEEKVYKFIINPEDEKRYTFTAESSANVALRIHRIEDQAERAGHVELVKYSDEKAQKAIARSNSIELTEYNTNPKKSITEYYLTISRTNPNELCTGKLSVSII